MKKSKLLLVITLACIVTSQIFSQNVAINATGANPHPSAALDVSSTSKGLLIPRMTVTERNSILNPARGLMIYNLTDSCLNLFDGTWSGCLEQVPQKQSIPDLVGWGYAVSGSAASYRSNSFYQSHRDKLFYLSTVFYF